MTATAEKITQTGFFEFGFFPVASKSGDITVLTVAARHRMTYHESPDCYFFGWAVKSIPDIHDPEKGCDVAARRCLDKRSWSAMLKGGLTAAEAIKVIVALNEGLLFSGEKPPDWLNRRSLSQISNIIGVQNTWNLNQREKERKVLNIDTTPLNRVYVKPASRVYRFPGGEFGRRF